MLIRRRNRKVETQQTVAEIRRVPTARSQSSYLPGWLWLKHLLLGRSGIAFDNWPPRPWRPSSR